MALPAADIDSSPMTDMASDGHETPTIPRFRLVPRPARSVLGALAVSGLIAPFVLWTVAAAANDQLSGGSVEQPLGQIIAAFSIAGLSLPIVAAGLPYLGRTAARAAIGFSAAVVWPLAGIMAYLGFIGADSYTEELRQLRFLAWAMACALALAPALMVWLHDGRWRWLLIGGATFAPLFLLAPLVLL